MKMVLVLFISTLLAVAMAGQDYSPASTGPIFHPALSPFQPIQSVRPNITASTTLGDFGEWLVQEDVRADGYKIHVHKRPGNQGIDLVATKRGAPLRIIEVKTRHRAWAKIGPDQLTAEGIRKRATDMAHPDSHWASRRNGRSILRRLDRGMPIEYEAYKLNLKQNQYRHYVVREGKLVEVGRGRIDVWLRSIEKTHPDRLTRMIARLHRHMFAVDRVIARGRLSPLLGKASIWTNRAAARVLQVLRVQRQITLLGRVRGPRGSGQALRVGAFLFLAMESAELYGHWNGDVSDTISAYGGGLGDPWVDTYESWERIFSSDFNSNALYRELCAFGTGMAFAVTYGVTLGIEGAKLGAWLGLPFALHTAGVSVFVGGVIGAFVGATWGFLAGYRDGRALGKLAADKFFRESMSEDDRARANDWMLSTSFKSAYESLD
ncbi:MAG: hypothetical protein K8I27_14915 [Planctomycetes bacterium]|nr:hypothetical protein [Planctomycetota bacterium]